MKKFFNSLFWLAVVAVVLWGVRQSVVFVDETEFVVVTNFGQLTAVYDQAPAEGSTEGQINDRGLHWKLPWQGVRRFDRRLQVFDPPAREMVTNNGNQSDVSVVGGNLTVSCFVCWRIPATEGADDVSRAGPFDNRPVVKFLRTVRSVEGAQQRLDYLVRSKLGAEIASVQLADLVNIDQPTEADQATIRQIGKRIRQSLAGLKDEAGIEVVDVEIKRLNFPQGNRRAVYERQKSERQRIASKYRSEGRAEAKKITSEATRESEAILAQAYAEAQRIRGEGEASATQIYAEAYGRDPEFFQLLRTLQAYEQMFGDQTTLVLSADSKMLKLLREGVQPLRKGAANDDGKQPPGAPPAGANDKDGKSNGRVAKEGT